MSEQPFASGPLRVSNRNPRYFEDAEGEIVYLTGSHNWWTLVDQGRSDPPPRFNWDEHLAFLQRHNHNFIRLWAWETTGNSWPGGSGWYWNTAPQVWARTGPGLAADGKPKYDVTKVNPEYLERLRQRVLSAGKQGIYVSVMFFDMPWHWENHPFNPDNNINGVNADPENKGVGHRIAGLEAPQVTALQEALIRAVIDAVNEFDNVLYEIANETGHASVPWQYHMIRYAHEYEKTKPKQHPVGMTYPFEEARTATNQELFDSPAEWISPHNEENQNYCADPPAADGSKVIIVDTDHIGGIWGEVPWVWKSLCRGLNPIFMDPYRMPGDNAGVVDPKWEAVRANMGYAKVYADRMNLAEAVPCNDLANTKYCLSDMKRQFLVFAPEENRVPEGPTVAVDMSSAPGFFNAEWFNTANGQIIPIGQVAGGAWRDFMCPFTGPAVLYLWR